MMKPWSITTTVRNPYRMQNFLIVLKTLEGAVWNYATQVEYQIRLIQERFYVPKHKNLTSAQIELVNNPNQTISSTEAKEILQTKHYKDPPMRGRQSFNPLKKFGFAAIKKDRVVITDFGNRFLKEKPDLEDIFLRFLLKWQFPDLNSKNPFNTDAYDIKPFVGVLHLIQRVNQFEKEYGRNSKGISKQEFSLFAPTLVRQQNIETHAQRIVDLRSEMANLPRQDKQALFENRERLFVADFLSSDDDKEIDKLLNNLKDYGDNAIRYFRLTSYIRIRGGGFYVDIEKQRAVEINALLEADDGSAKGGFDSKQEFLDYIADPTQPTLPWDTPDRQAEIIQQIEQKIHQHEQTLEMSLSKFAEPMQSTETERKERIARLSARRRKLQAEVRCRKAQKVESIQKYISILNNIYDCDQRPVLLEKTATLGLCAFNDAIGIEPQYPVGDDDEPTFTAPANTPDIECFYTTFNAICEVTMLVSRDQWYNEGQPVMRHLRGFEHQHPDKPAYCLFIAPQMHRDTVNTFWTAVKFEYEGQPQRIVPLTIKQFAKILGALLELRSADTFFPHMQLQQLFDDVLNLTDSVKDSTEWMKATPETIQSWGEAILQ